MHAGTVIPLFCRGNIFGRHWLSENLLHEYYSGTENFFIEILLFGRWSIAVPSIDHSNSVPHTHAVGCLEQVKVLQEPLLIYLCTHDTCSHTRS